MSIGKGFIGGHYLRRSHEFYFCREKWANVIGKSAMRERKDELDNDLKLTFKKVYDFAIESPLNEIDFILAAAKMNREASEAAKNDTYGHSVSTTILSERGRNIFGDNLHSRMVAATAAACDIRMAGAMVPVMSNSGSGNQGIAATLPVSTYAENTNCSEEQLVRALVLSNLCMIYIKQYLGRLSALCGCVVASTGACCGIAWLMGGSYEQITYAAKNMIAEYHRHDLRRSQTELCPENCEWSFHRNFVGADGSGG